MGAHHNVVHGVVQEEMHTLRQEVNVDVTSQVSSNVATNTAQRFSDIVDEKLNDKFSVELHASEEGHKKYHVMENRARDNTLFKVLQTKVGKDVGEPNDDETQPPPDSHCLVCGLWWTIMDYLQL